MKDIIFLGGLPRAGNTLLASLFMQHPKVAVTANSNLVNILHHLNQIKNNNFHKNFPDEQSIDNVLNNVVDHYYSHWKEDIIIDRAPWGTLGNLKLIKNYIKPKEIKFIFLKRPFKEVLGSFYRMGGIYTNIDHVMAPNQMIKFDYQSVGTVLQDPSIKKLIIEYEDLVKNPQKIIDQISSFCGTESFKLDLSKLAQLEINGIRYQDEYVQAPLHTIKTDKIEKADRNYDEILPIDIYNELKHFDKVWEKTPNYNFINVMDVTDVKLFLSSFMNNDWDKYKYEQETFDVHNETQTISLIYDEEFHKELAKRRECQAVFVPFLGVIEKKLLAIHQTGFIVRAILVKLPAGSSIKLRQDSGKFLENTYRYHLPIQTNKDVIFTVGGESKNLEEGFIWEIKNSDKINLVKNDGATDRIHLIIDWKK